MFLLLITENQELPELVILGALLGGAGAHLVPWGGGYFWQLLEAGFAQN